MGEDEEGDRDGRRDGMGGQGDGRGILMGGVWGWDQV